MYGIFLSQQDQAKVTRHQPQHEGRAKTPNEVQRTLEDLAINSRKSGGSVSSRDSFSTITTVESTRIQSIKSSDHSSKYSRYVPSEITFTTSTPSIEEKNLSSSHISQQQQQQPQQQQQQQQRQRSNRTKPSSSAPKSTILNELDDSCVELSKEVSKSRRAADFYRKAAYAKRPSRKSSAAATSRRQVTDDGDDCALAPGRIVSKDS